MKLERILMPTDFSSCADAALGHAIFLAKQFQAELHLLHVVVLHEERDDEAQFPDHEVILQRTQAIAQGEMRKRLGIYIDSTLEIVEHERRGAASAPEITTFAAEQGIDLIIMGAHGRRGWRRLLLGSVAEEVVRTAPCPVLTLRDRVGGASLAAPETILVPVDLSEPSRRALTHAKELAAIYGAKIALLHVVPAPMYPAFYTGFAGALEYSFPELSNQLATTLTDWAAASDGPEVELEVQILEGNASREIIDHCERIKAGLIVLATHGLTGWHHVLLGSVSEKVIRMAECPVLTLRLAAD